MGVKGKCAGCGRQMSLPQNIEGRRVCGFCRIHIPAALKKGISFDEASREIQSKAHLISKSAKKPLELSWEKAEGKSTDKEEDQDTLCPKADCDWNDTEGRCLLDGEDYLQCEKRNSEAEDKDPAEIKTPVEAKQDHEAEPGHGKEKPQDEPKDKPDKPRRVKSYIQIYLTDERDFRVARWIDEKRALCRRTTKGQQAMAILEDVMLREMGASANG